MSYKCKICNLNDVENFGDICELCAIGMDPYAADMTKNATVAGDNVDEQAGDVYPRRSGKTSRKILLNGGDSIEAQDSYGSDMATPDNDDVQVYAPGQIPQGVTPSGNNNPSYGSQNIPAQRYITAGITKNISVDTQKKSALVKWFRALFKGIPFTLDNEVTMFQVFPDYSGTALNSMGNACDQVIVYGKLNSGAVSENNEVEVFGRRDSNNNVIAKMICNKASGTTILPMRSIKPGVVWIITGIIIALIITAVTGLGVEGIIWTAILLLCFTNLPFVFKVIGALFAGVFSLFKRLF